jgi:DEAD/DEAH box helicase domain-containing protein
VQKGIALYYLGDYRNAIAAYDEALKINPEDKKVIRYREMAHGKV